MKSILQGELLNKPQNNAIAVNRTFLCTQKCSCEEVLSGFKHTSRRWGNSGALRRLGLKEEEQRKNTCSSSDLELEVEVDKQRKKTGCLSTTNFELPEELPSVEEQLKRLELVVVRQIQQTTTSTELPSVEEEIKQLRFSRKREMLL